jgi:hypothetical protein
MLDRQQKSHRPTMLARRFFALDRQGRCVGIVVVHILASRTAAPIRLSSLYPDSLLA